MEGGAVGGSAGQRGRGGERKCNNDKQRPSTRLWGTFPPCHVQRPCLILREGTGDSTSVCVYVCLHVHV